MHAALHKDERGEQCVCVRGCLSRVGFPGGQTEEGGGFDMEVAAGIRELGTVTRGKMYKTEAVSGLSV